MEKHTHIVQWSDGQADWHMTIKGGKVDIRTNGDATKADAAKALSEQWTALMGFVATGKSTTCRVKDVK